MVFINNAFGTNEQGGKGYQAGRRFADSLSPTQISSAVPITSQGLGIIGYRVGGRTIKYTEADMSDYDAGFTQGVITGIGMRKPF